MTVCNDLSEKITPIPSISISIHAELSLGQIDNPEFVSQVFS